MKLLITGFEPFNGESINPSFEAVKLLPDTIEDLELIKLEVPCEFKRSRELMDHAIKYFKPDYIINVGQAGGRKYITPEKNAVNNANASIPDNEGYQPKNRRIHTKGKKQYETNLPIEKMIKRMEENNIPCEISYSAGEYVCNNVMYHVQFLIETKYPNIKAGFIHVPFITEQVKDKPENTPYLDLEVIVRGLHCSINALID